MNHIEWLGTFVKYPPDIKILEPSIQSLSILFSYIEKNISEQDLLIIATAGYVAMKARLQDENKFLEISPKTYFEYAHYLCDVVYNETEATEENFHKFLENININK